MYLINTVTTYSLFVFGKMFGQLLFLLLLILSLNTFTQYSVIAQGFSKIGASPLSHDVKANKVEGVPQQPPDKVTCTTLTSQAIHISWVPPPSTSTNEVIRGYRVIYGPSDTWFDENTKFVKIAASVETILHSLKKYTNYTIEVQAFTPGGDGVSSAPAQCQTEPDVPEPPMAVKALVVSADSILVSWKPPRYPNGIIENYRVYFKQAGTDEGEANSQEIVPDIKHQNLTYEAKNLDGNFKYEFWVTASNIVGESQPSKKVTVFPNSSVPAKIASFDGTITTTYYEDVSLPCLAVGVPASGIIWKIKGVQLSANDHIRKQPDGSLLIRDVSKTDAGEYSCHVENDFGQDTVTHQLIVKAPPYPIHVTVAATTTSSLTIKVRPHFNNGYTLHYKPEYGDWETIQVGPNIDKFTLQNLLCGTNYQLYVTAHNSNGTRDSSGIINISTRGDMPIMPSADKFIVRYSNNITLHFETWLDGGCPILYFIIEYKQKNSDEWILASNNLKRDRPHFVLSELKPGTWYNLRITAHNQVGFAVAQFETASLM